MADDPTRARANRIAEVFAAASELPADEQAAFLAEACGDDAELRREVSSLLEASERTPATLGRMNPAGLIALLDADEADARPSHAGPFRLTRELGRGGMGAVYLGEREGADFTQRVAVKIVRRGMRSDAIVARFRRERRILAALEHPSVARFVDGGLLDDGRPWLAMEHVDGEPLLAWCDQRRLGIAERLRLFESVCRAVAHAHGQLIAHLDLKPSNVLVTEGGSVKLLDFGIAKLLAAPDDGEGAAAGEAPTSRGAEDLTLGGARPLTPRYAAPEQWRGDPVSVATDVFALGVLLGELLAGRAPTDDRAPEAEPQAPSRLVAGDRAEQRAALRGTRPGPLAAALRGDLDAIALRALARDPAARYPGAAALGDDVARYLADQPVTARRGSRAYRLGKLVRRHRLGVALATLAGLALVAGTTISLWQARLAADERDRARREASRATITRDFLVEIFESADPALARGEELTASELLERGIERIDAALGADPEVHADMLSVLGRLYRILGKYPRASELLERAVAIERTRGEPASLALALERLAEVRAAQGRAEEGEVLLREALALQRTAFDDDPVAAATMLDALGENLAYQRRWSDAERPLREALAIRRRALGDRHLDTLSTMHTLANAESQLGRHTSAVELHREALAATRAHYAELHPEISSSMANLANALTRSGAYAEATRLHRRALAIEQKLKGDDHPLVATRRNNLAVMLRKVGELEEAEQMFRTVLASDRKSLGERHPYVGMTLDNLATVQIERGRLAEARAGVSEADRIYEATKRTTGITWATHLEIRAKLLLAAGDAEATRAALEAVIAIRGSTPSPPAQLATTYRMRGTLHERTGARDAAEADYRRALAGHRAHLPAGHSEIATTLFELGRLLVHTGRRGEAVALLDEAAAIRRRAFPETSFRRAETEAAARACRAPSASAGELAPLVARVEATLGGDHRTAVTLRRLIEACRASAGG